MNCLSGALGLDKYKQVALVGGGGKTSALFRLAQEQAAAGKKVALTTTTRMYVPAPAVPLVLDTNLDAVCKAVEAATAPTLIGQGIENDKVVGVPCTWTKALALLPGVDLLIYEADGSRNRPLKFPAEHEPVVCGNDLMVIVIGLSGVDMPLSAASFQRPELAEKYLRFCPGTMLTPERIADLIYHPQSYGRYRGKNDTVVLLNQADTAADRCRGADLARALLRRSWLQRVVVTALQAETIVCDIYES